MKNRDKIMQMNLYDLLLKIHDRSSDCVLYLLTGAGVSHSCPVKAGDLKMKHLKKECKDCIQEWLNQNVDF